MKQKDFLEREHMIRLYGGYRINKATRNQHEVAEHLSIVKQSQSANKQPTDAYRLTFISSFASYGFAKAR